MNEDYLINPNFLDDTYTADGYYDLARSYGSEARPADTRTYEQDPRPFDSRTYGPDSRSYGPDSRTYGSDSRTYGSDLRSFGPGPDPRPYGPGPDPRPYGPVRPLLDPQQNVPYYGPLHYHSASLPNIDLEEGSPPRRKRSRKDSGEENDNELLNMALTDAKTPLYSLTVKLKSVEDDDSIPETRSKDLADTKVSKEGHRQIFAMVWLLNSCEPAPTSVVPRNRIYAKYVSLCADYSLHPVSPANLGKLVKMIFPKLTVRRLGMRGQSKYHYCGILLGEDALPLGEGPSNSIDAVAEPLAPSYGGKFANLNDEHFHLPSMKYVPRLFPWIQQSPPNTSIDLPSIYPYVPRDVDIDIADTLYALYRVHCATIVDCVRSMALAKLFLCFVNFNTILTAPVFKLYTTDDVLPWVQACDVYTYKIMIKMVIRLHFGGGGGGDVGVDDNTITSLAVIRDQYREKLLHSIQNRLPRSFISMKLRTATIFTGLLARIVRLLGLNNDMNQLTPSVNALLVKDLASISGSNVLLNQVPCSNQNADSLLQLFRQDIPNLLNSLPNIHTYTEFLTQIPSRFPRTNSRMLLLVTNKVLTTITQHRKEGSLATWWTVKCWAEELLTMYLEMGGVFFRDIEQENHIKQETEEGNMALKGDLETTLFREW